MILFLSDVDAVRAYRIALNELGRAEFERRYGPINQATLEIWNTISPLDKENNDDAAESG